MNCNEVQDCLTAVIDNRPLEASQRRDFDTHVASCESCRADYELERATKLLVARRAAPIPVPPATVSRIRELIEAQARLDDASRSAIPGTAGAWRFARKRPVWAVSAAAVAVLAVLFLWPRPDRERGFNESPVAFIRQAIANYDGLIGNTQTVQLSTTDESTLRQFFSTNGVCCEVLVPQLRGASLVGGSVSISNRAKVAHVVYRCGTHLVCLCQVKMDDVCPTNNTALTDSARSQVCAGGWYWYRSTPSRSVGLWKIDGTLCAATSDCDPQEIAALFTDVH